MRLQDNKPIIGHTKILEVLSKRAQTDRLAQAFLFIGPEQVGKTTVAKWLAATVLGIEPVKLDAHSDFSVLARETDAKTKKLKSRISIEQVRDARERLAMSSFHGGVKTLVIEEAHLMSTEAANALLKTIEEPAGKSLIILVASSAKSVPATIVSRCETIRFTFVSTEEMVQGLKVHGHDKGIVEAVAPLALGRPGLATQYAEDQEGFNELLEERKKFNQLLTASVAKKINLVGKLLPKGGGAKEFALNKLDFWEHELHQMFLSLVRNNDCEQYQKFAKALKELTNVRQAIFANTNPQLSLEKFLLKL